jgi:N-acetylglucosamine kinase-like BadF-type ATPase
VTADNGGGRVLAVDGGGAKTDLALLDDTGALLSFVRGGRSHVHYLQVEGSIRVVADLLESALTRAGLDPLERPLASSAYVLLAGADLPEERAAIQARIEQLEWSARPVVDNDTLALLRAGTDRGWGIAVVCGAGINCLGLARDGREVRFLSLGPLSGDWGGGSDVGMAALSAAARSVDGRGPATVLESTVPAHFGLTDPLELARAIHLRRIPQARLGELAPVVLAASDDDPVAAGIVNRLADEVIALARATLQRLELTRADPDVVLGGGILRAVAPGVVEVIGAGVADVAPSARVLVAPSEPIVGAVLLGLDALGADGSAKDRARAELDAAVAGVQHEPAPTSR